ncbi:MAG: indolepyruvate ferredoxin oxidoreductase subunit beta [Thermoprotei archaeon]|nr:MAG: indolepyruvate ferredoxin oxidoreductase subunit beta [Thermoprotei archaeon]
MVMPEKKLFYNIMIAGVGGQGTVLLSRMIGDAAIKLGLKVRIGETFGAAMRGGAVHSHVRVGPEVYGPLLLEDEADALLALEPLEGLRRGLKYLKPDGIAIVNTRKVYPVDVNVGAAKYPDVNDIINALKKLTKVVLAFDATEVAERIGDPRVMNVVVLGAFAKFSEVTGAPFNKEVLLEAVKGRVPARALEANIKAFEEGYKIATEFIEKNKDLFK